MPMIQVKLTIPVSAEQDVKLHTALTNAVVDIFHKQNEYVMVHVEKEADLWMAGQKLSKGGYLSASLMGDLKNNECDAFTAKVCEILKNEFDIEGAQVYTTFQSINQWGWNSKIL